jgi:maltose O-acetyltransferase
MKINLIKSIIKMHGQLFVIMQNLRNIKYRYIFGKIGRNCEIGFNLSYFNGKNIELGNNVSISHDVDIIASGEKVIIGNDCLIAQNVLILTRMHNFENILIPMRLQGHKEKPILIENDVWIGAKSVIMPGVTLGVGSIIGAGSIVTKDVLPYSIVAGVPASFIRSRIIN